MGAINSTEVFEKQTNGTVFYREGKLNEFPQAKNGVFESWRYNFDAGRQIFRAESDDGRGRVYEKRLVKDIFGNPQWTGWMEIPDAEARGVQAIAINDRPLQLPNVDGAIKLQITPSTIDTFSKLEIYELIQQKINDNNDRSYIYVPWVMDPATNQWAANCLRVLEITFPDGGLHDRFYLVEPHPGTSGINEAATYYIWCMDSHTGRDHWQLIDAPDLRAFVSYPVFYEHTRDKHFHLTGDHERQAWNAASGKIDDIMDEVQTISGELHTHIADIDNKMAPHLTPQERLNWNQAYESIHPMPDDHLRYIVQDDEYAKAYEQIQFSEKTNKLLFNEASVNRTDNSILRDNLLAEFNAIENDNNRIHFIQVEFTAINTHQTFAWLTTDTGINSEKWTTQSGAQIWKFRFKRPFNRFIVKLDDITKTVSFNNVKIYAIFSPMTAVNIGDYEQRLPLNLIGPETAEPMYNGKPLSQIIPNSAETAEWGKIFGNIDTQNDLHIKLAELLKSKISTADMSSHKRWDVYRDSVIASLIQQPNSEETTTTITVPNMNHVNKDDVIFDNLIHVFNDLKEAGRVPYDVKLTIKFVSSRNKSVYFETNNVLIPPSPTVASGPFTWNWPGSIFEFFNRIFIRGNGAEYISDINLHIYSLKFGDVFAGDGELDWNHISKHFILNANGNIELNTAENFNIKADGTLNAIVKHLIIEVLENRRTIVKGMSHEIIEGDSKLEIHGNNVIKIDGFNETDIKGYNVTGIYGNNVLDIKGNDTTRIDKDRITEIKGDNKLEIHGNNVIKVEGEYNIDVEELFKIVAEDIILSELAEYDYENKEKFITIYGTEIDKRYAGRKIFEDYVQESDDLFKKLENAIRVNAERIAEETRERIKKLSLETEEREREIIRLEELIKAIQNASEETVKNIIIEVMGDNYYTKDETHNIFYDKSETYDRKTLYELFMLKTDALFGFESFDLVIGTDEQLAEAVDTGTFATATRILFKTGNYTYNGDGTFDFTNVRYIKGEEPVNVIAPRAGVIPGSFDRTILSTIIMTMGFPGGETILNAWANEMRIVELDGGEVTIELDKYHHIYRFIVNADTAVLFNNVDNGRKYVFYVDQVDEIHKFAIRNYLHNADHLNTLEVLKNAESNMRVVIHAIGTNEHNRNGMIINSVIPLVDGRAARGNKIIVGNLLGKLHESARTDLAVWARGRRTGQVYGVFAEGQTVTIESRFTNGDGVFCAHNDDHCNGRCTGWTHHSGSFDWVVHREGDKTRTPIVPEAIGRVGTIGTFIMPRHEGNLILDFRVDPMIVAVDVDPLVIAESVIDHTKGFSHPWPNNNRFYQVHYNEVHLEIIMKCNPDTMQGWHIHDMHNNIGMKLPFSFAWIKFIRRIPTLMGTWVFNGAERLLPTVRVTPFYYKKIYEITNVAVLNPGNNQRDLVFYEDNRVNNLRFDFLPPDADDPITIVDRPDWIEIIGEDRNQRIRITDPERVGQPVTVKLFTASGYKRHWTFNTIFYSDFEIAGEVVEEPWRDDKTDNLTYILRKCPKYDQEYEAEIDWKQLPTHQEGSWSILGSSDIAEIVDIVPPNTPGSDKVRVKVKRRGRFTLMFTWAFDPSRTATIDCYVYVHIAAGFIRGPQDEAPFHIHTSDTFQLRMIWQDSVDGVIIPDRTMSNVNGRWDIMEGNSKYVCEEDDCDHTECDNGKDLQDRAIIDAITGHLTITNREVRGDGEQDAYDVIRIRFISACSIFRTSTPVIAYIEIRIFRGQYRLTFTNKDSDSLGVNNIPPSSIQTADKVIPVVLIFNPNHTVSERTFEFISELPGFTLHPGDPSPGIARFIFNMPYRDVEIHVTSKDI